MPYHMVLALFFASGLLTHPFPFNENLALVWMIYLNLTLQMATLRYK